MMRGSLRLGVLALLGSLPAIPAAGEPAPEAPALASLADAVEGKLASDQRAEGFWLTAYTPSTAYAAPAFEKNTFTTAMILSILDPVGDRIGVAKLLAKARAQLSTEIEPSGLVRYHGRPNAPELPALGIEITPDADDTALVWSLMTEADPSLLSKALATLKRYRTAQGLYLTWLAPRSAYVGIDPGTDPNPADVGIQMDVLVMLAKADRPAASELQRALGRSIGEERLWVYYRSAPVVPLLREGDLAGLGYPVSVPEGWRRSPLPSQANWTRASQLLARFSGAPYQRPSTAETQALLRALAPGGAPDIERNPPLLYHNDLTAKVRRYYWSADFGFAMWLRLFSEGRPRTHAAGN